jgi:GTPase
VVDASDPAWEEQEKTVSALLTRLGVHELPRLTAYNKMDLLSPRRRSAFGRLDGFPISAESGKGLHDLLAAIEKRLSHQWVEKDLLFSYNQGARLAQLHEHMDIVSQEMTEQGIRVRVRTHPATLAQWLSKKDDAR